MASNEDLKQAIYENLMNALNSNVSIRNQGEENLKKLQFIEGKNSMKKKHSIIFNFL
jgi:hypothetical protein